MRVLIVDDHTETRELLTHNIARAGYSVRAVGSCSEAEHILDAAEVDALVLDVMLPDGSGIELRARACNVPILL